jgi:hypothetical protein
MFEDFDYDYNHILEDVDDLDLYEDDEYHMEDEKEWDNYYHNIADELVDD